MQNSAKFLLLLVITASTGLGAMVILDDSPSRLMETGTTDDAESDPITSETPTAPLTGTGPEKLLTMTPRKDAPPPLTGESHGMISGRIALSTRILDRLKRYTVIVQEDVNTNGRSPDAPKVFQKTQTFKADLSRGTPYFDIPEIPFSKHPYRVTVAAEGMNGSSGHIYISADQPRGKGDVQLSLTPGSYFSVVLRDQRQNPREGLQVRLVPVGDSFIRRDAPTGRTSRRGYVLFENVLKGEYEIFVGPQTAPLAPPKRVRVSASYTSFSADGRPSSQGITIVVPDGEKVTIEVFSSYGYGVENAQVKFFQLEVKRYFVFEALSERSGRAEFENIPYGTYQVDVRTKHNGIKTRKFKVEKGKPPPIIRVNMLR